MSFFVAERNGPSASNASAAWVFWAAVSDFWTPNQVKRTRQAAMVVRSRWAGVVVLSVVGRVSVRSSKVVISPLRFVEGARTIRTIRRNQERLSFGVLCGLCGRGGDPGF